MFDRFARVLFRLPLDEPLDYRIPPGMDPQIGSRVLVDINSRQEIGIVCEIADTTSVGPVLDLQDLLDPEPVITPGQIELAHRLADYYICGPGEGLFKMFPSPPRSFQIGSSRGFKIPEIPEAPEPAPRHTLNPEQEAIYKDVKNNHVAGRMHLLHGITGSGKTEVYIHLMRDALEEGQGAILLVPEIALTVQMIERLQEVFGSAIALLHSGLPTKERFLNYLSILQKKRRLVVGTRSAIFAPVDELKYIIIDEEHDSSYRENSAPRYDARLLARWIASTRDAMIIAGSATPRLESRRACQTHPDHFHYHTISGRASGSLPEVQVLQSPMNQNPISGQLITEIEKNLKAGQQTILLLNRRGYQPFIYCDNCASTVKCPRCSVTLHFHKPDILLCHYCSFSARNDGTCPECGGKTRSAGTGVQRLEEFLGSRFLDARIERVDTDTSRGGKNLQDSLQRFFRKELDILMGTQMIAKGLDAPDVTLVGVLQADQGLMLSDYRAQERTFSLLMQVAGRAGRGQFQGRVLIEALNPEHSLIHLAAAQDYRRFYDEELGLRRATNYPPFCRLLRFLIRSPDQQYAEQKIDELAELLENALSDQDTLEILGPAPAPIERIHDQYRMHILIKTRSYEKIRPAIRELLNSFRPGLRKGHLEFEPDPQDVV
ncbi:MAG: primosomal protein N' [Leptospiraceae bacterium]|nr:primosomal protein N' [Leptospiraceae bacterium]